MSFANAKLIIGYSRAEYDPEFVKRTFNTIFGEDFVGDVIEKVFTPTGRPPYKKFYISINDHEDPGLKRITELIDEYKFATIVYKNEWDRTAREYVDRYWKVYAAPTRPVFQPYLMTKEQMDGHVAIEPWSVAADPAFETPKKMYVHVDTESECEDDDAEYQCDCPPCRLNFPDFPPPMVRDNGGPFPLVRSVNSPPEPVQDKEEEETDEEYWLKHGPCKLARMDNECLSVETDDDEEDTAKDFDELAAAIAQFGEDYPGSIAPKIPPPPPLTRCNTEEWYKFNSCKY
jgi:hypothetical protein